MIKSDFEATKKELMSESNKSDKSIETKKSLSDYRFPVELIRCNQLYSEILLKHQKTHNIAALASVITIATSLTSGSIWSAETSAPSSLYLCLILPTGSGKNILFDVANELLSEHTHIGNLTSVGAFDDMVVENPNITHIIDEFGDELGAMLNDKGGHKKSIMAAQKTIYSSSNSVYHPQKYSSGGGAKEVKKRKVLNPCYSVIGLSTEAQIFDKLNSKLLSNGFVNRFIFVNGSEIKSIFNTQIKNISAATVNYINTFDMHEKVTIKMDTEAKVFYEKIGDVDAEGTDINSWVDGDNEKREISVRWRENALRLSLSLAGYEKFDTIPLWLLKWAYSFVKFNSIYFINTYENREYESIVTENINAALKWFSNNPNKWHKRAEIARNATRLSKMISYKRKQYLDEMIERGHLVKNDKNEYKIKKEYL